MTEEILGYDKEGKPIHPAKKGYVYTQAFILCSQCSAAIRSNGGPMLGSLCVPCHEAKEKQ